MDNITRDFGKYNLVVYDKNLPFKIGDSVQITLSDTIGFDKNDIWIKVTKNGVGVSQDGNTYNFDSDTVKESRMA